MRNVFSLSSGALFGIGLLISGMVDTIRVQGWLDENPALSSACRHGIGVRAPSRPSVLGQFMIASGSFKCENGTCA